MAGVIAIGSAVLWRGSYNDNVVYYFNNEVTMYSCVFVAIANSFSGVPPVHLKDNGDIELVNITYWRCIIDNVELYNASLGTHSVYEIARAAEANYESTLSTANNALQIVNLVRDRIDGIDARSAESKRILDNRKFIKESTYQSLVNDDMIDPDCEYYVVDDEEDIEESEV